ncbi:hypothetical protein K1719_044861 [Acacia pycnantha]|nr:hypothetical protein K1719_044861 [Acacia pycnantha]
MFTFGGIMANEFLTEYHDEINDGKWGSSRTLIPLRNRVWNQYMQSPSQIGSRGSFLVLQGQRLLGLISRFRQARAQNGSDHGIKAQGDGWLLTITLIECTNLAAVDSSGFSDPYVAFTCNGKTRTSSIKFQKSDTLRNEIFEFGVIILIERVSVILSDNIHYVCKYDLEKKLKGHKVLEGNPNVINLSVPGCTILNVECIVNILKDFKSIGTHGVKNLRIGAFMMSQESILKN